MRKPTAEFSHAKTKTETPTRSGLVRFFEKPAYILYPYRPRFNDWHFWVVQALVIAIAFSHVAFESTGVLNNLGRLYFVPIALMVAPVVYAALYFGMVGAITTAVWVILLTVPNLVLGHGGWERWGEIFQLLVLAGVAVFTGHRVDRERSAQCRAETSARALYASETKYRRLFESSPIAILVINHSGSILEVNPSAGLLFGIPLNELKHENVATLIGREGTRRLIAAYRRGGWHEGALTVKVKDGSTVFLEPSFTSVPDSDTKVIFQVMLRDVTEERNRQAGLKAYTASVLRAQEEERQRIARELHDETIQNLALLCRRLDSVRDGASLPPPVTEELLSARSSIEQIVKDLRDFTRALRPAILDDLGLVASIRRLVVDFNERTRIKAHLKVAGQDRRLPADTELGIFRIAQEALWNVEHHAKAAGVQVMLTFSEEEITLEVADDGVGFEIPVRQGDFGASGKLGLMGMWERAELLGGKLDIQSAPGKGTCVIAVVPVQPAPAAIPPAQS